jgi:hypothetical protein
MKNFIITVAASSLVLLSGHAVAQAPSVPRSRDRRHRQPGRHRRRQTAESKGSNAEVKAFGKQMVTTTRASTSRRWRWSPSSRSPRGQRHQQEPEGGRRRERQESREAERAALKAYVDHHGRHHQPSSTQSTRRSSSAQNAGAEGIAGRGPPAFVVPRARQDVAAKLSGRTGPMRGAGAGTLTRGGGSRRRLVARPAPGRRGAAEPSGDPGLLYVPETLTVRPGDVVVWINKDPFRIP